MSLLSKAIAGGLAGAALLLSAGAALAYPGVATGSVNVRTGPGVGYPVIDQLYPGERVDIGSCGYGWCYVRHSGPDGYVSARFLSPSYRSPPIYRAPPVYRPYYPPPYYPPYPRYPRYYHYDYDPGFCIGNPNASICINP